MTRNPLFNEISAQIASAKSNGFDFYTPLLISINPLDKDINLFVFNGDVCHGIGMSKHTQHRHKSIGYPMTYSELLEDSVALTNMIYDVVVGFTESIVKELNTMRQKSPMGGYRIKSDSSIKAIVYVKMTEVSIELEWDCQIG